MYQRGYDTLVEVDGPSIEDDALSDDLKALQWPIEAVWFLSRHRAASGQPSLTVHPIGNHAEAAFGGSAERLSPAAPRDMGALLRRLRHHRDRTGLEHQVTYEATHHGPTMEFPSLFVEIGSDEAWYSDRTSAEVLAAAVTDVLDGEGHAEAPVYLGIGGGHYVPQQTDRCLAGDGDFGHLVPAYALDAQEPEATHQVLQRAWEATPGAQGAYVHKKGLKGPQRRLVMLWADRAGVPLA